MLSDSGEAKILGNSSVAFALTNRLSPLTSLIFLEALSLKGDYPHPMAHDFAVYASRASLPNTRKTRYEALPMAYLDGTRIPCLKFAPAGERQLRLAH